MEFKRLRQGTVNTWNVPNAAQRNGDFSSLPAAQWPRDPLTGQPFANGIIPSNRFSPNSKNLIDNYPQPNFTGAGGNFVFFSPNPLDTNQYIYKVDYNLNERHQIEVHYLRDYYTSLQNTTNLVLYDRDIPGTNASAKWAYVMSPTTVNTFQFTFTGNVTLQGKFQPNPIFVTDYSRTANGITYPMIYGNETSIPSLNVAGFNGLGVAPRNWNNFNRIFQFKDDYSKVIGNHNFKTGILVMRSRKNQDNQPDINGTVNYSVAHALSSGNALADALLGNFNSYSESSSGREGWFRFRDEIRGWKWPRCTGQSIEDLARKINPKFRGWFNYYVRFTPSALPPIERYVGQSLVRWACRKHKKLRNHRSRAWAWLIQLIDRQPNLRALWEHERSRFSPQELYEWRRSRTFLREPQGAIPRGYLTPRLRQLLTRFDIAAV